MTAARGMKTEQRILAGGPGATLEESRKGGGTGADGKTNAQGIYRRKERHVPEAGSLQSIM